MNMSRSTPLILLMMSVYTCFCQEIVHSNDLVEEWRYTFSDYPYDATWHIHTNDSVSYWVAHRNDNMVMGLVRDQFTGAIRSSRAFGRDLKFNGFRIGDFDDSAIMIVGNRVVLWSAIDDEVQDLGLTEQLHDPRLKVTESWSMWWKNDQSYIYHNNHTGEQYQITTTKRYNLIDGRNNSIPLAYHGADPRVEASTMLNVITREVKVFSPWFHFADDRLYEFQGKTIVEYNTGFQQVGQYELPQRTGLSWRLGSDFYFVVGGSSQADTNRYVMTYTLGSDTIVTVDTLPTNLQGGQNITHCENGLFNIGPPSARMLYDARWGRNVIAADYWSRPFYTTRDFVYWELEDSRVLAYTRETGQRDTLSGYKLDYNLLMRLTDTTREFMHDHHTLFTTLPLRRGVKYEAVSQSQTHSYYRLPTSVFALDGLTVDTTLFANYCSYLDVLTTASHRYIADCTDSLYTLNEDGTLGRSIHISWGTPLIYDDLLVWLKDDTIYTHDGQMTSTIVIDQGSAPVDRILFVGSRLVAQSENVLYDLSNLSATPQRWATLAEGVYLRAGGGGIVTVGEAMLDASTGDFFGIRHPRLLGTDSCVGIVDGQLYVASVEAVSSGVYLPYEVNDYDAIYQYGDDWIVQHGSMFTSLNTNNSVDIGDFSVFQFRPGIQLSSPLIYLLNDAQTAVKVLDIETLSTSDIGTYEDVYYRGYQYGDYYYYVARTEENGQELWESNGSAQGTRLLFDSTGDQLSSLPTELMINEHTGYLYWSAEDHAGHSLYAYNLPSITSSTEEAQAKKPPLLIIFPNPASDYVVVSPMKDGNYYAYNQLGQPYQVEVRHGVSDVSSLPAGIYTLLDDKSGRSGRFIKID